MSRRGKEHDVRRTDQRIKFTHRTDRDKDQHREKLIGDARLIEDRQKSRFSSIRRDDRKVSGDIGKDTAHPHREEQHRLIVLLYSEPDQDCADGKHDPDRGVGHAHDTGE